MLEKSEGSQRLTAKRQNKVRENPMKAIHVTLPLGILLAVAGGALMVAAKSPSLSTEWRLTEQPRHPVTPEMWKQADAAKGFPAPAFEATDTEGQQQSLASLTQKGPLFLYFALTDCPCTIEAQPHYERLSKLYRGKVSFLAVTNADVQGAKSWKSEFSVPYPVVSSPDLALMKLYGVNRSVYALLIGKDGKIIRMWPGYSAAMLQEVNSEMEEATGSGPVRFDTGMAPKIMTSGCEFPKA